LLLITLMMEVVRTSATAVTFYETTRRNIPAGYHLHTRRRENLKSRNYLEDDCLLGYCAV
jgi:hypothetical protein